MPLPRRACSFVTVCALALAATTARAEPTPTEKETARSLMHEGYVRETTGDRAGALEAYRSADAIMKVPTTGLAVARALVALGRLVEARDRALGVARIAVAPDESPPIAKARVDAAALADELAPRIASIVIEVRGGDATIEVDGARVPPEARSIPWRVDPGKHRVTAKDLSGKQASQEIVVAEGAMAKVALELAVASPGPSSAPSPLAKRGTPALAFVGFGLGVVGLGAGLVTGVMSASDTSKLKEQCPMGACASALHGDISRANTLANVANVSFAVAGAGVLVGVLALAIGGGSGPRRASARGLTLTF